jgi:hypothetical protein
LFKRPLLVAGALLLVLGAGNWIVSRNKLIEYNQRAASSRLAEPAAPLDGQPNLTAAQNAALLERLHPRTGAYSFVQAKLDFYRIVNAGGRVFVLLGLLLAGASVLRSRRERRTPTGDAPHREARAA